MWLLNPVVREFFHSLQIFFSAIGTCISLLIHSCIFTAGFVKPELAILPKHHKSILRVSFAYYAAISCLKLSVAPVKIS